jgi:hypothetical protein
MALRTVLGPLAPCPVLGQTIRVAGPQAVSIARTVVSHVDETGHLPSRVNVDGTAVGPGPLLAGYARRQLALEAPADQRDLTLEPGAEETAIARGLVDKQIYKSLPGWPPHRSDLQMDRLALHLAL